MRLIIPLFLMTALAPAQIVSVGVKAGIPVTEALPYYEGYYPGRTIDTGRWTVGPTIEFHLISGLSVEADALYRGYREEVDFASEEHSFTDGPTAPAISVSSRSDTKAWDFPLLLKYRIGARRYRPFVDAGVTFSHTSTDVTFSQDCLSSASVCAAYFSSVIPAGASVQPYYNLLGHQNSTINT